MGPYDGSEGWLAFFFFLYPGGPQVGVRPLSIASESPSFMLISIVIEIGPKIDSWVGWHRELRLELPVPLPDDPERRRPNKAHRADCRGRFQ